MIWAGFLLINLVLQKSKYVISKYEENVIIRSWSSYPGYAPPHNVNMQMLDISVG